jgi:hypothetical protein
MDKRTEYIDKYNSFKKLNGGQIPLKKDFLKFSQINDNALIKVFGKDAYSVLQQECGDKPNRIETVRTSTEQIFEQYGQLLKKHNRPLSSSDWVQAGFRPNVANLKKIHNIKWSDMELAFVNYASDNAIWKDVVGLLSPTDKITSNSKLDKKFLDIVDKINAWTPDRKRGWEEGYKIELRRYLEQFYNVEEEVGDTNIDLLLNKKYPIEIKKDPTTSEYDRLLGQMIRHNKQYGSAIAVVTSLSSQDRFIKFQKLFVDIHDKLAMTAEIIHK